MPENLYKVKQYFIANEFFEKGYAAGSGPCNCQTTCCHGGVWLDVNDRDRIIQHTEIIKKQMDDSQPKDAAKWFDNIIADDSDFPSGKAVGTEVYNDKCAFLDNSGRCSIQLGAVAAGEHKWAWKPAYCVLFPVEVSDNIIGFDPMLQGDETCCTVSGQFETPLFVACKDELTYLLGPDGYSLLEKHYATLHEARP